MAIVWPCPLPVEAYVAAGRDVEVPPPPCPSCTQTMAFWGFYTRYLRVGEVVRLLVHRVRCGRCRCSHALLPDFVAKFRAVAAEHPGDERFTELIEALQEESEQFQAWWPRNTVEQALTGQIAIRRPPVGVIRLDVTELTVASHPSLTLCVQVPAQSSDREKLARII